MRSPLEGEYRWLALDEVASTQDVAEEILAKDEPYGVVFAGHQTKGRGRHGRVWLSKAGDSLAMSMIFRGYPDHPAPYLIGMAVAIAAAKTIHCQLQWPNDLVIRSKKVGGILTELKRDRNGRLVPIVGLGINLNQAEFAPEIADRAVSLSLALGGRYEAEAVARGVLDQLSTLPEPTSWGELRDVWMLFDATPGKKYQVTPSETAVAIGIGGAGELVCTVDGEARSILAADAIFAPQA